MTATAAQATKTPDVTIEIEKHHPDAKGYRSLYRINYRGEMVGWLVFPYGFGECFRIHDIVAHGTRSIGVGKRVGIYYGNGPLKSKDEALDAVPALVSSGALITKEAARAKHEAEAEEQARESREQNDYARAENQRRADTIKGLTEMLADTGLGLVLTDEYRKVLGSSLRYVRDDIPEMRVRED